MELLKETVVVEGAVRYHGTGGRSRNQKRAKRRGSDNRAMSKTEVVSGAFDTMGPPACREKLSKDKERMTR